MEKKYNTKWRRCQICQTEKKYTTFLDDNKVEGDICTKCRNEKKRKDQTGLDRIKQLEEQVQQLTLQFQDKLQEITVRFNEQEAQIIVQNDQIGNLENKKASLTAELRSARNLYTEAVMQRDDCQREFKEMAAELQSANQRIKELQAQYMPVVNSSTPLQPIPTLYPKPPLVSPLASKVDLYNALASPPEPQAVNFPLLDSPAPPSNEGSPPSTPKKTPLKPPTITKSPVKGKVCIHCKIKRPETVFDKWSDQCNICRFGSPLDSSEVQSPRRYPEVKPLPKIDLGH